MARPRGTSFPILVMACCLGAGCRSGSGLADGTPLSAQPDPDAIAALPGYRAGLVDEPVFSGQAFVLEAGPSDAHPIVLVHGLGENGARDWYPILPVLAQRFRVLAFDLPGFGRSTKGHDLYSPERYADFIHALAGQRTRRPFHLLGHSMGGAISIAYASKFPDDVSRLVLIDAAGILHRKAYVNFAAFAGIDNLLGLFAAPAKELANAAMEATSAQVEPLLPGSPDPSLLLKNEVLRKTVLDTPTRIAALAVIMQDFAPSIAAIRAPSWIVWGGRDGVASLRAGKLLAARLPHGQLRVIDKAGHDPMLDAPEALSSHLLEALTGPVGPQRAPGSGPTAGDRIGRCEDQSGTRFTGNYASIEIVRCQDVVLSGVRAKSVQVRASHVTLEDSRVEGQGTAVQIKGSRVEITAADLIGEIALEVEGSDVDLAGVHLKGSKAAVHVVKDSKLVVSVSHIDSPNNQRYLHDVLSFGIGVDL